MNVQLAVIIPCLDEEKNLEQLLGQLSSKMDIQVVVVDGGSTDRSCAVAASYGCKVVRSPKGRARQMNYGVQATEEPNLLFLHADTRLPDSFPALVNTALQGDGVVGGAFALATDKDSLGLRLVCAGANLRSRFLHLPYGDQALFTTRAHFEAIGGYPELAIMEDYVFIKKLARRGRVVILREQAVTSARRWENVGLLRTTFINQLMVIGYKLGVSTHNLARLYRRVKGISRKGN